MGYRFYTQQLEATGNCPGAPLTNRRKRKMAWTNSRKLNGDSQTDCRGYGRKS